MNKSSSKATQGTWLQPEAKGVLLRLVVFILVLFTTYYLASWLHPFGPHRFFWNLILGATAFDLIMGLILPWFRVGFGSAPAPHQSERRQE